MRWQGIHVETAAVVTGVPESAESAVAAGRYDAEEAARSRQRSVSVSEELAGPELAVAAGRAALRRGGRAPGDFGLLIHAACWYPGLEFWNVAAYVQQEVLGHGRALAFELRQMSNGGMSALEMAASRLTAAPAAGAALLTTGDRFAEPAFPRWRTDRGLVFGDAGTAVVVSREPVGLRLVATAAYSEPVLEGLHRGDEPFLRSGSEAAPLDLVARKKGFLRHMPVDEVTVRNESGMLTAVKECLAEAECDLADMASVIVPFFGAELSLRQCLGPLGVPAERTLHDWGLEIGHLGAGDQFAGLARLLERDELRPGDRVLAVGVGAGFSWTCAVLERV
ncbi:ketoacyl-ACP synthase III family protein [Streptomyces sp. NPDC059070]|uniref:ketoacyl-ACP synthase III family protein n=1 Tax=unclassified Streptomyces TaxID=2593676 RepID=UPI0034E2360C